MVNEKTLYQYWKEETSKEITEDKIDRIVYSCHRGATKRLAAQYAGITVGTLNQWIEKALDVGKKLQQDEPLSENDYKYLILYKKMGETESEIQMKAFEVLQKHAYEKKNWKVAESILKLRFGDEYGVNSKKILQVEGAQGGGDGFKVTYLFSEEKGNNE